MYPDSCTYEGNKARVCCDFWIFFRRRDEPPTYPSWMFVVTAWWYDLRFASLRKTCAVVQVSQKLKFLTGDETKSMMKAHLQAGLVVGEPFVDRFVLQTCNAHTELSEPTDRIKICARPGSSCSSLLVQCRCTMGLFLGVSSEIWTSQNDP